MKTFIKELFANRLGIVLAALNVCYFASRNFINYDFSHGYGKACWFNNHFNIVGLKMQYSEIIFSLNSPAILFSLISTDLMQTIFPYTCGFELAKIHIVFTGFFTVLQWLFIGWTAKTIARTIRPNNE